MRLRFPNYVLLSTKGKIGLCTQGIYPLQSNHPRVHVTIVAFQFPEDKSLYLQPRHILYLLPHKTLNLISTSPKLSCQCSQQIFQRNKSRDNKLFFKWMSLASCSHICKASQERIKSSHQHFVKKDTATFGWQILAHEGKMFFERFGSFVVSFGGQWLAPVPAVRDRSWHSKISVNSQSENLSKLFRKLNWDLIPRFLCFSVFSVGKYWDFLGNIDKYLS